MSYDPDERALREHIVRNGVELRAGLWIYPFHGNYPNMPSLFHATCDDCGPDAVWSAVRCGERDEVARGALEHWNQNHEVIV